MAGIDVKVHPDIIQMVMQRRAALGVRELLNQWSHDGTPYTSRLGFNSHITPRATSTTEYIMPVPPQRVRFQSGGSNHLYESGSNRNKCFSPKSQPPSPAKSPRLPQIYAANTMSPIHAMSPTQSLNREYEMRNPSRNLISANEKLTCESPDMIFTNRAPSNSSGFLKSANGSRASKSASRVTTANSNRGRQARFSANSSISNKSARASDLVVRAMQSVNSSEYSALKRSNSPKPIPHLYDAPDPLKYKQLKNSNNFQRWKDQVAKKVEIQRMKYSIPVVFHDLNGSRNQHSTRNQSQC